VASGFSKAVSERTTISAVRSQSDDEAPCGSTFSWHVAIKTDKKDKNSLLMSKT
jgi:hypothetical protein